jgi:hypothetical protein
MNVNTTSNWFSGMSINAGKLVAQHSSTLGGGNLGNGSGRFQIK